MEIYKNYTPMDISVKSILYLLNCPVESIVMSEDLRKEEQTKKLRLQTFLNKFLINEDEKNKEKKRKRK